MVLWFCSIAAQIWLTALLFIKRHFRTYPAFATFIAISCLENVTLLATRYNREAYFYTYWMGDAACVVAKVWLLIELFHSACQTEFMERVAIRRFYVVQAVLFVSSIALTLVFPSRYPVPLMAIIRTADTGASLMLCLSFIALMVTVYVEGTYLLRRTLGIGAGLLLYLPIKMAVVVLKGAHGPALIVRIRWIEVAAYLGTLILWTIAFHRPEVARTTAPVEALERRASELEA